MSGVDTNTSVDSCAWCETPVAADHAIHRPASREASDPEPIFCSFLHLGVWLRDRTAGEVDS